MQYRPLGRSGLSISEIGFGCMSLEKDKKTNERLIHHAIASGINYFDTADIYQNGENESCLGHAVRKYRNKTIIATKVGNVQRKDGTGLDWDPSKDHIFKSVEKSLIRLQTDYIDLYQLHGGTIEDPIDETIEAFELLKQQGKIRHYGISSIRPNVIKEYIKRSQIDSVMMQYSLLDRRPEETCLGLLAEKNISVLARGVLANGMLMNKPAGNYLNYMPDDVSKACNAIASLSNDKRSPTQIAIRFSLAPNQVAAAVIGIRTMEQLDEAINTERSPVLTEEELSKLKKTLQPNCYAQHR